LKDKSRSETVRSQEKRLLSATLLGIADTCPASENPMTYARQLFTSDDPKGSVLATFKSDRAKLAFDDFTRESKHREGLSSIFYLIRQRVMRLNHLDKLARGALLSRVDDPILGELIWNAETFAWEQPLRLNGINVPLVLELDNIDPTQEEQLSALETMRPLVKVALSNETSVKEKGARAVVPHKPCAGFCEIDKLKLPPPEEFIASLTLEGIDLHPEGGTFGYRIGSFPGWHFSVMFTFGTNSELKDIEANMIAPRDKR